MSLAEGGGDAATVLGLYEEAVTACSRDPGLLIAYAESEVEIGRDAKPLSGVKGFTHQPVDE